MVHALQDEQAGRPCVYVDACTPEPEAQAEEYLWSNFLHNYETNRAPFGLNMHAAWFARPEYLSAMGKFIDKLLSTPDVYIVNVRQMIEWMKAPVTLSEIKVRQREHLCKTIQKIQNIQKISKIKSKRLVFST